MAATLLALAGTARGDGIGFAVAGQPLELKFDGRLQIDHRDFDSRLDDNGRNADGIDLRRARLGASIELRRRHRLSIDVDFVDSRAELNSAYLDVRLHDAARLRFGQFKMPFGLDALTSSRFSDFQERSLAAALAPGIERGAMLYGQPARGFVYALALSRGTEDDDADDRLARVAVDFGSVLDRRDVVLHTGIAWSRGQRPADGAAPSLRSEARGLRFFDVDSLDGGDVTLERVGLEAALALGPFKLQAESARVRFGGTSAGGVGYARGLTASYVSASWLLTGEHYADAYSGGDFGRLQPRRNFGSGPGAIEIGLRYSRFDGSDFSASNADGSGVLDDDTANRADAWTIGLKWIVRPDLRLLLDHVYTRFGTPVRIDGEASSGERAVLLRAQIDF